MISPNRAVKSSVIGYASHTPVIPHRDDNRNVKGMIRIKPLKRDRMWDGSAFSMEVSSVARMILYPANADDRKYSLSPGTAISYSSIFFSLLKTAVICRE